MADFSQGLVKSFAAAATMNEAYVCVKIGTNSNNVALPSADNQEVLGVIQDKASANGAVPVMLNGSTKVVANSAITKGDYLTAVTTTGRVQTCPKVSTTWTGTANSIENVIGIALESATASGQIIEMLIRPFQLAH